MRLITLFSLIFFILSTENDFAQCEIKNVNFSPGETIELDVKYTLGFLWFDAGYVTFKVDTAIINGKKVYKFTSRGSSYEKYDWIFKVREYYISYATQENLTPLYYSRNSLEGDYFAKEEYVFNHIQSKTYSTIHNSKTPLKKDTLSLPKCGYDLLTAIYAFRNIDFDIYKPGDIIPITVIIDNKWENLYIRFINKEIFNSNNKKIPTYHLKAQMLEGTIFNAGENTDVWVTQSPEKIPIYIEAQILVGKVKCYLKNYKKY